MYLHELLKGLDHTLCGDVSEHTEISVPVTDSREAEQGSLFICIDGTERKGSDYAADAAFKGVAACVAAAPIDGIPTVVVSDTRMASAVIWNNYYGDPSKNMRLYAVTGTNGKTSTAVFLKSILECDGRKTGIIGTLGCSAEGHDLSGRGAETSDIPASMTTPDPKYLYGALKKMKDMGVTDAVMEVSSHSLLQKKVDALHFEVGIFTNLSEEHLDCHGDMESYFAVKSSLFCKCKKAVVNSDDLYGRRISGIACSMSMAENISCDKGCMYTLRYRGNVLNIHSAVCGSFNVYNTMLASVAALESGVSASAVEKGIEAVQSISGRMEHIVYEAEHGFDVYIDYAHTPKAMDSVLSCFAKREGCLTALFGCGGDRDSEKRPLMGRIASELCDRVIITSDNPRGENKDAIIKDITAGISEEDMKKCIVIPQREQAIRYAVKTAVKGEILLLLGKGHEEWETLKNEKRPFSEKNIVRSALCERYAND